MFSFSNRPLGRFLFTPWAVVAALGAPSWAVAQTAPPAAPAPASLKEVTVTANPLGATELIAPSVSQSGVNLLLRSQSTLGETLDGTPGVSSSYFGPNASRPVIRGQDGDRIRILGNGGASMDASGLSADHAVAADPISMERIEVLRGPGALMYGASAAGGVVNVIDNRIPREALFDAAGGVTGKVDLGTASANRETRGAALLETGTDRYALHADVFSRSGADVKVPLALACTRGGVTRTDNRICNSASRAEGGAGGGSVFWDQGYLGLSASSYRSNYGTVAEAESSIRMRSDRVGLEGEVRGLDGWLRAVKGQWSATDYAHTESDAGVPLTTFSNRGQTLRLEARQAPWGGLDGVIGLQLESSRFAADGAEAFAPYSRTREAAVFALEEWRQPWGKLSLGARVEQVSVASDGNPQLARFVRAQRDFTPVSTALGALVDLGRVGWRGWQASSNLSWSQRAPKDYELFADGPHNATGTYEVGNAALGLEKALSMDAGLQWKEGAHSASLSVFDNRFSNYLLLAATGRNRDALGNAGVVDCGNGTSVASGCTAAVLPEYAYRPVRARFSGLEAEGTRRLRDGAHTLDLSLRADLLRATNQDTGEPLPRIAPARLGSTLVWTQGGWGARLGADHALAQSRVPAGQLATASYTLWNAALTWRQRAQGTQLLWYARLENAGNRLAYPAGSILTQTAPGRAPLPGRNLKLGVQASF